MARDIDMKITRRKPFDPYWYTKERREDWVLAKVLAKQARELGDKVFITFESRRSLTYAETDRLANKVANRLLELGIQKGDRVAVLQTNSLEYVVNWFGILKAGAVMAPINTAYKLDFLQYTLDNSDSRLLFVSESLADRLLPIEGDLPTLERVVVVGEDGADADPTAVGLKQKPVMSYSEFLGGAPDTEPQVEYSFIDIARLMYTSGTTGRSKGVTKSNAADYYSARGYIEVCDIGPDDVVFTCLPLFHSNAQVLSVYPALIAGAKAAVYGRFSASQFWKWIKESGATVFNSLGAMNYFLWNQDPVPEEKEHKVRIALLAPSPHDMLEQFLERFNLKILEGYGLTETGVVTYMRPDEPFRVGSCGKEAPAYEVKIVDSETDEELDRGQVGEIVVRPRIPNIMLYYYHKMPEKTVEDFRNFWFHTGDAGRMDEDGYVYFVDRVKDYIRRRGENISSFEVEKVVTSHPAIAEAAAFGIKAEGGRYAEDEVMVVAVKEKGKDVDPLDLIKYCEERMPYFMIPSYIRFVDELPKTPTQRVRKHLLKDEGITPDTWDIHKAGYKVKK